MRLVNFRSATRCPLPVTVMDFIYNFTQTDLEITWPCEVRFYWLSLQPFVRFVRFLIGYVTPFIIILGKESRAASSPCNLTVLSFKAVTHFV